MLNPIHINATSLSDAWFQTLYKCIEQGSSFVIDQGSYEGQKRLEFDYITIHIKYPATLPLLPQVNPSFGFPNPVAHDYLDDYLPYLMGSELKKGESYTYGSRLTKVKITDVMKLNADSGLCIDELSAEFKKNGIVWEENCNFYINQIDAMIYIYKNNGYRNNQMCLMVGDGDDFALKDPACLKLIDTKIQDGKLHFFPYFRSWDLFNGFPANLAAIEMMKQYCSDAIGVENGEIIASSKGLHIYDYVWEIAETLRGRTIEDFKKEIKNEAKNK